MLWILDLSMHLQKHGRQSDGTNQFNFELTSSENADSIGVIASSAVYTESNMFYKLHCFVKQKHSRQIQQNKKDI